MLLHLVLILLLSAVIYPQGERIGKHTAAEWRHLIDSTWGSGRTTEEKLQIFDTFWNAIDQRYAGFQGIEDNWQKLRSYRDTVALGVSKGRFAGIMGHMVASLHDGHVWMMDKEVVATPLKPGIPLLHTSGFTFPSMSWNSACHFGAALTPLPDSTLLVYAVAKDHPLGLTPGDVVLGYDGKLWKDLYKKLLQIQFPIPYFCVMSGSERAGTYNLLQSAGMNWHLFDTIDIVKYSTGDTLHLPTSLFTKEIPGIHVTEQLPVEGVPLPDVENGHEVSCGYIKGTKIGYIYVWGWGMSSVAEDLSLAVNAMMPQDKSDGLIIDMRLNEGGNTSLPGLRRLFNQNVETMHWAERASSSDHLAMKDAGAFYLEGANRELYDRPIAVLCGPSAISSGDMSVHFLRSHPMVRTFGLPTNGSFGYYSDIPGLPGEWLTGLTPSVCYTPPYVNNSLNHKSIPVDEEVWLTKDGVAKGEDDVVKKAVEWINNHVYAHNLTKNSSYLKPGSDTLKLTASVENPKSHQITSKVYIKNLQGNFADSLDLVKTSSSGKSEVWKGSYFPPNTEDVYKLSLQMKDITDSKVTVFNSISGFSTAGPVKVDSIVYQKYDLSNWCFIKPYVHNRGNSLTLKDAYVRIQINDPCVTSINPDETKLPELIPGATAGTTGLIVVYFIDSLFPGYFNIKYQILIGGLACWEDSMKVVPTAVNDEHLQPLTYTLEQNYPNPFNPSTTIQYSISEESHVTMKLYDILGNEIVTIVNEDKPAGNYKAQFDGSNYASGIYFYRLKAGRYIQTKKMILLR